MFSVVTGGALHDNTKNDCVADNMLRRHETPAGWGFCSRLRTVISAPSLQRNERCAVPVLKLEGHISEWFSYNTG